MGGKRVAGEEAVTSVDESTPRKQPGLRALRLRVNMSMGKLHKDDGSLDSEFMRVEESRRAEDEREVSKTPSELQLVKPVYRVAGRGALAAVLEMEEENRIDRGSRALYFANASQRWCTVPPGTSISLISGCLAFSLAHGVTPKISHIDEATIHPELAIPSSKHPSNVVVTCSC